MPEKAEAQSVQPVLTGGTNVISSNTLVRYSTPVISVNRGRYVALVTTFNLKDGNGITNVTFKFDASIDQAYWHSNYITWGVPATSTTTNTTGTNIDIGSFCYLRLNSITNGNDTVLTNLVLRAIQKSGL
jgi:hypothetical protein